MGLPPDAGRGINPFLNYRGGEEALLTQAGRGLAAIKQEIETNGTGVYVLRCECVVFVCVGMCVLLVCVCHSFLFLLRKAHNLRTRTLDRRREGMHGLRAQQGSGQQRQKIPKRLDARPRTRDGPGATGERCVKLIHIYVRLCLYTFIHTLTDMVYTHTCTHTFVVYVCIH